MKRLFAESEMAEGSKLKRFTEELQRKREEEHKKHMDNVRRGQEIDAQMHEEKQAEQKAQTERVEKAADQLMEGQEKDVGEAGV